MYVMTCTCTLHVCYDMYMYHDIKCHDSTTLHNNYWLKFNFTLGASFAKPIYDKSYGSVNTQRSYSVLCLFGGKTESTLSQYTVL